MLVTAARGGEVLTLFVDGKLLAGKIYLADFQQTCWRSGGASGENFGAEDVLFSIGFDMLMHICHFIDLIRDVMTQICQVFVTLVSLFTL